MHKTTIKLVVKENFRRLKNVKIPQHGEDSDLIASKFIEREDDDRLIRSDVVSHNNS